MTQKIYTLADIKRLLTPVFSTYHIKSAVLFGSYAKNCAVANSDIDIVVDSGLKGLAFYGLLEDVVNALDKSVDLLDVRQIQPSSEIEKEIKTNGVLIYKNRILQ